MVWVSLSLEARKSRLFFLSFLSRLFLGPVQSSNEFEEIDTVYENEETFPSRKVEGTQYIFSSVTKKDRDAP